MRRLKTLAPAARGQLSPAFLEGSAGVGDISQYVTDFYREVNLDPLRRVIDEAMARFPDTKEASDAWLAPRVHATVRLTRREAADARVWTYLAVVELSEYVRWRWGASTALGRFAGSETNQALARLWWGAEFARNGPDYSAVAQAFEFQDIPNTWFRLDAFHHRPAALAALRTIGELKSGKLPSGKQVKRTRKINMLSTAFNTALSTRVLDAAAPWAGDDAGAVLEWIGGEVDETLMLDELPRGPADEPVSDEQIASVNELLRRVGEEAGLFHDGSGDDSLEGSGPDAKPAGAAATTGRR